MNPGPDHRGSPPPRTADVRTSDRRRRILFLDDDPQRALAFLSDHPDAVWVETVEGCLTHLESPWDEVHLDHDLGGETFVDCGREDCGMAIVRWLCLEPRPHLGRTRFVVHSHNPDAANLMVMQMFAAGFQVERRPFGAPASSFEPDGRLPPEPLRTHGWGDLIRALLDFMGGRNSRRPR